MGQTKNEGLDEVQIVTQTLWLQKKDFSKTIIILKYVLSYGIASMYELL